MEVCAAEDYELSLPVICGSDLLVPPAQTPDACCWSVVFIPIRTAAEIYNLPAASLSLCGIATQTRVRNVDFTER